MKQNCQLVLHRFYFVSLKRALANSKRRACVIYKDRRVPAAAPWVGERKLNETHTHYDGIRAEEAVVVAGMWVQGSWCLGPSA